ncbi:MAG: sensor histidine kinase [Candidatus Cryptobacteroides sp.]
MRRFLGYSSGAFLLIFILLTAVSCVGRQDVIEANVLLYWPTDENDPVYQKWTEIAETELRRQGIKGDIQVHYAHIIERYESVERPMFNELILRLRSEGRMPDLILSYGDANRWLMVTNEHPVVSSIPLVCYGLQLDDYLPYQYDLLEQKYGGGRWNMVNIRDRIRLRENLELADSITPSIIDHIRTPEYYFLTQNRFITMLDVENLWADRIKYEGLNRQMDSLDPDIFYNNLVPKVNEDALRNIAVNQDKVVLSCRSIMAPKWNLSLKYNQIATTWAFYPQKSPNFFIQAKHDNKAKGLVDGPSFMPYFTMVAEDFLVNEKCIGGYFPAFEDQIKDAVGAGVRMLRGETPDQIGNLEHTPTYNINWKALRPFGFDVNKVPDFVNLHNVTLKDRNPKFYRMLMIALGITVFVLVIWSAIVIFIYSRRARRNALKLRRYANETILNNEILRQTMDIVDFKTWEVHGNWDENFSRISTSQFFLGKLRDFMSTSDPGKYAMQIHCSIDGNYPHWYEIRMTVDADKGAGIVRRGVMVNIDNQKELEAKAAETNRIINAVRTREGFIASMNHEIRTPLNSIVGYAQLLSMPGMPIEPEELEEYAAAIDTNASILQTTINNILITTRIGKSLIAPKNEKTVISEQFVPEAVGEDSEIERLVHRRVVLEPGPDDITVKADPKLLSEVLENLIVNAARFSDESTSITLGWDRSKEDGWAAEIWVKDNGIGIEPKHQELIFERFFKVDSFTAGCGLGLYICKTFVELMGGQISVESKVGEGSVFRIKLA